MTLPLSSKDKNQPGNWVKVSGTSVAAPLAVSVRPDRPGRVKVSGTSVATPLAVASAIRLNV